MPTCYPDPVSPRCDPVLLGQVSYDPFGVLPDHRVAMCRAQTFRFVPVS